VKGARARGRGANPKIAAKALPAGMGLDSIRFRRPLCKLTLEMSFDFFPTKRVFRVVQYDGIDHFVAFDLSGEKRLLVQFLVGEFHSSAISERFNPLVTHSAPPSGDSVAIILALRLQTYKSSLYGLGHMVDGNLAIAPTTHCDSRQAIIDST